MIIRVEKAEYVSDYKLKLAFNTGESAVVDLQDVLEKHPLAKALQDKDQFRQFYLDEWPTLAWPNGFDLAPEFLYEKATGRSHPWTEAS